MTRTSPSTAAGSDGHAALLAGWLRRARGVPEAAAWVLRGSLVTAALCPGARAPADVDYLVPGDAARFDAAAIERIVRAIAAAPDPATALAVESAEVIFAETQSPGLRAHLAGDAGGARGRFQVDLAVGDPMGVPPRPIAIAGVGLVRACAPETLFAWKLHCLCEFGTGRWRAKDLCDLDLLWRHAGLEPAGVRAAVALAFSSRDLPLAALDDFRARDSWGRSRGGVRKWRALAKDHAALDDFLATRARVRAALDALLA
jgi:hypothetical protein